MEEMGDNARVWRVYNDEADRIDAEMVEGWRSTLDTLLIFAGLFSAVVATFVTQTTQNLQPNFSEVTASLLTELVSIQRIAAINGNLSAVNPSNMTHDTPFTPARRDVILNGIWFVSLGLTLTTALLSGLVKQWLHFYVADVSGSAKERACTRQFRFMGLAAWGVPPLIEFLPVLMNASLLLFLAGLILFCQGLSGTEGITMAIIILTVIPFAFYLCSSILSVVYPRCPYKSSLSTMLNLAPRIFWHLTIRISEFICGQPALARYISFHRDLAHFRRNELVERENALAEHEDIPRGIKILLKLSSMRGAESRAISHQRLSLQLQTITLMVTNSSNSTVPDIALQALAGLHAYTFSESSLPVFLWHHISETLLDWFPAGSNLKDNHHLPTTSSVAERYSRALLCLINQLNESLTRPISTFMARSDPNDLSYLGLRALLVQQIQSRSFENADQIRDALIQHIHQLPPIEYHEVHPWIRAKLRQTVLLGRRVHRDEDRIISDLVRLLSPLRRPTLQMDVMLYQLERINTPYFFSWDQDAEQKQSGARGGQIELAKGPGHTGFIFTLPSLARVALSIGTAEHDSILRLLDEMFTTTETYTKCPSWKPSPWDTNSDGQIEAVRREPFRPVLEQLLDTLVTTEDPECGRLWKGSVPLRLRLGVIMRLHNTIYGKTQYHRPTLNVIFNWHLRSSTYERYDGESPKLIDGMDQKLESELSSFFFGQFSKQGSQSLLRLSDYLAGHRILGLTKTMRKHLAETAYPSWRGPPTNWIKQTTITGLDRLFRYFLQRNPSNIDQYLPSTEEEQQNTVVTIVELACNGKPAALSHDSYSPWNAMMASWLALLKEASAYQTADHLEAATLEQEDEVHLQPTRPVLDFAILIQLVEQALETPPKE